MKRSALWCGSSSTSVPNRLSSPAFLVREQRPGWFTIDIPPTEHWAQQREQLTDAQRERMDTAEFYKLLRQQITVRAMALKSS